MSWFQWLRKVCDKVHPPMHVSFLMPAEVLDVPSETFWWFRMRILNLSTDTIRYDKLGGATVNFGVYVEQRIPGGSTLEREHPHNLTKHFSNCCASLIIPRWRGHKRINIISLLTRHNCPIASWWGWNSLRRNYVSYFIIHDTFI